VIDLQRGRTQDENLGGTLRLGSSHVYLQPNTKIETLYHASVIQERHRHRYEVNPAYHQHFQDDGKFVFSGWDESKTLVETIEIPSHPFFIAAQYHPEFLSRPLLARPLFLGFIQAAKSLT
jgi:CTP synthase